jgi:2-polyprenyl-6-methoxyphenol hydroxylase-like FAD-dependent oxidoreductase
VSTATNTKRASSSLDETPVLIVGGGPVGLTLDLTLAQQGVAAILVERNPSTTTHPKMDITNGRSMELFHHVAWRGDTVPDRPEAILDHIRGAAPAWPTRSADRDLVDSTS